MSRSASVGLAAALAAPGAFAMALCAEITRRDASVFRYTTWDAVLTVAGQAYDPSLGIAASSIESNGDGAVDQMQVTVLLNSVITTADLRAGRWNGATVRLFVVNANDTSQGALEQRYGWIGNISLDGGVAKIEFLSLSTHFQSTIGEVVSETCLNDFCGPINSKGQGCGLDVATYTVSGTVTSYNDTDTFDGGPAIVVYSNDIIGLYVDDEFADGKITFSAQSWISLGIRRSRKVDGALVLKQVPPFSITAGMAFSAVRGCTKQHQYCISDRLNGARFRGFPHLKGNDKLLQFGRRNGS